MMDSDCDSAVDDSIVDDDDDEDNDDNDDNDEDNDDNDDSWVISFLLSMSLTS